MRIPGGVHLSINKADMRSIVKSIPDIIVSTGMACSTTDIDPVFSALKRTEESRYSLRLQLGFENTDEEVEYFIQTFSKKINKARQFWGEL
jgi:cysteine sulfinate desulfinase/cysteine desulfurase-like protein